MSLVTDSPVHSSSSDDFAAFLDADLSSYSSASEEARDGSEQNSSPPVEEAEDGKTPYAPNNEADGDSDLETKRIKRTRVEKKEITECFEETTYGRLLEQNLEASTSKEICTHPGTFGGMCIRCGQKVAEESGVTFGYVQKGLRLGNEEIVRLRNTDMKNLLRHRKLYLVLDLDHTLLNSTLLIHMTPEEEYLRSQTDSLQDVSKGSLFMLNFMHMMTKLRPFVRTFLQEASKMFEMYIYTMGDRAYALEMAKLLDPGKEYFSGRVISRDDGTQRHQKGLDVVLGQESAILILDDTESELEGNLDGRDVRQVLKTIRKDVLKGCKIVFSRVFPTQFQADNHHLWKVAEQLGATCTTELDQSVTHVVATDTGTDKARWAVKHNKLLVHPKWLEATNFFWQKQPEENFPVNQQKNQDLVS